MELSPPETGDAFRMLIEGGQIVIEFGRIARDLPGTEVTVTDRIVLPFETGRRLLHHVSFALRPFEARLRAAQARALPPAQAGLVARPGLVAGKPATDRSGEEAARLLQLVGAWGAPRQFERSFRITAGSLQSNRFLLSLNPADIPGDARDAVLAACVQMGMPAAQHRAAHAGFGDAAGLHLGFEGDAQRSVGKLYLEYRVTADQARLAHATGQPALLHLAFKWPVGGGEGVTTRYLWHPLLTAEEIALRLRDIYRGEGESLAVATAFLAMGAEREAAERLQYLEVEEAENGRRSFDLNLYNAKLLVRDVQPLLQRMRAHFGVRPGQFQALYDQVKGMSLGHLAGGVHRDGQDFFNVYYGVTSLPAFSRKL